MLCNKKIKSNLSNEYIYKNFDRQFFVHQMENFVGIHKVCHCYDIYREKMLDEYSVVDMKQKIAYMFSVYHSDKVQENGFKIRDRNCWNRFDSMLESANPLNFRMSMNISA